MFIRFDRFHKRYGQTDTQTLHDNIGRACMASRRKNELKNTPMSISPVKYNDP